MHMAMLCAKFQRDLMKMSKAMENEFETDNGWILYIITGLRLYIKSVYMHTRYIPTLLVNDYDIYIAI